MLKKIISFAVGAVLVFTASSAFAGKRVSAVTQSPVASMITGQGADGMSTVIRNKDSVGTSITMRGLTPGNAYTLWVMSFDKPEKCVNPCACGGPDFANPNVVVGAIGGMTGRVADEYGQATMASSIAYGVLPSGPGQVLIPNPIANKKAHLALVVRDHGPASSNPAVLEQQLNSWGGGCDTFACFDSFVSDHASPFCRIPEMDDD